MVLEGEEREGYVYEGAGLGCWHNNQRLRTATQFIAATIPLLIEERNRRAFDARPAVVEPVVGGEGVLVLQIEAPVLDEPRGAVPLEDETEVGAGVAVAAEGTARPLVVYG